MNAEEYYKKEGYLEMDSFDKKMLQFNYYELIEFAEDYYKAKLDLS